MVLCRFGGSRAGKTLAFSSPSRIDAWCVCLSVWSCSSWVSFFACVLSPYISSGILPMSPPDTQIFVLSFSGNEQAELLDPAVKGTLNVLGSCKKASIKKVVVTSSMAAVAYNRRPRTPEVTVDETWFSDPQICETNQQWYILSKTLAEEAAWKFSRDNGLEIVTINPAMVIGPLLQPTLNTSAEAILKLINGSSSTYPNFCFGWVNVKDVALAHILAYEVPSSNGRYCMVERVVHYSELVNIIRNMYPTLPLPDKCADDKPFVPPYQVSKEKIKSIGIELIPLETSVKETIESLKEKGFASF
ncbi:NAD(P)-binding Rossmann-fold superfamily protein [Zea mays]|uniref:NAD(P)-binding Rossmann-fold superfamily protein n=1 Tax=Zea mays TaxID=4577 RepID=A0A1D6H4R0_MAIZE|nr:NAD(P)-binding Rossmann-fold superfamily protein [Zea mays]